MQDAISKGVRFEVGEVTELLTSGQRLDGVRAADGTVYTASKILLATGAWTPWLMAPLEEALKIKYEDSIDRQLFATGVCTAAFKLSQQEAEYYRQMPILIYGTFFHDIWISFVIGSAQQLNLDQLEYALTKNPRCER